LLGNSEKVLFFEQMQSNCSFRVAKQKSMHVIFMIFLKYLHSQDKSEKKQFFKVKFDRAKLFILLSRKSDA